MWESILAAMLMLQQPGQSIYSQVVVAENSPPPCGDEYSLLCSSPRWSDYHDGFTVAETWDIGIKRYYIIALALEDVISGDEWETPKSLLWKYVISMIYHESGFRRDVHEGVGAASRGDCSWTKGENGIKTRVPGSCKSHCLAQIMLGPRASNAKTSEGWTPDDLVGLDYQSTKKCLHVATRILDDAYQYCSYKGPRPLSTCIISHYAGGNIRSNDKRVISRIKTINKIWDYNVGVRKEIKLLLESQ